MGSAVFVLCYFGSRDNLKAGCFLGGLAYISLLAGWTTKNIQHMLFFTSSAGHQYVFPSLANISLCRPSGLCSTTRHGRTQFRSLARHSPCQLNSFYLIQLWVVAPGYHPFSFQRPTWWTARKHYMVHDRRAGFRSNDPCWSVERMSHQWLNKNSCITSTLQKHAYIYI